MSCLFATFMKMKLVLGVWMEGAEAVRSTAGANDFLLTIVYYSILLFFDIIYLQKYNSKCNSDTDCSKTQNYSKKVKVIQLHNSLYYIIYL